jgi:hypothetical protein
VGRDLKDFTISISSAAVYKEKGGKKKKKHSKKEDCPYFFRYKVLIVRSIMT